MEIAKKITVVRQELQTIPERGVQATPEETASLVSKQELLRGLEAEMSAAQGEGPLIQIAVDNFIVSEVISGWTGIPTGRMLTDEIETVHNMGEVLGKRIIGQDHVLAAIAQRIQTAHAGIEDPSKPTGVFLMVGPSGVGKTETALAKQYGKSEVPL